MALFESYERRIDKINEVLNSYGIASLEEAEKITKDAGLDVYNQIKGIQPICFENACWAYITGAAIAIKKGCTRAADAASARVQTESQLGHWPCQIKLVPTNALYFDGAKLLIAADCSAYAYARMHEDFMRGKITIIGCPKLDSIDYSEKLTQIIQNNNIQSVTVVRMEVPCCGGLELAAKKALQASGKFIPWQIVTISLDGKILE